MNLIKIITVLLLLISVGASFSTVSITSNKPTYHCGFDVVPNQYACEPVTLKIKSMTMIHDVHLVLPYDYKNGEISQVRWNGKTFKGKWSNFFNHNKKEVTLNSFNLMPGTTTITLTPVAHGDFKWNATLYNKQGIELASLDPWFNSSFKYRHEFNLTSSSDTLTDFQVKLILNSSNINYSETNNDGSDLRLTWLNITSGNEQEIPFWIREDIGWNKTGNSYVWVKAPLIDIDGEQFYYYYGNNTAVNSKSNGFTTFPHLFDDFDDGVLNTSIWNVESGTPTETGGYLEVQGAVLNASESHLYGVIEESLIPVDASWWDVEALYNVTTGDLMTYRRAIAGAWTFQTRDGSGSSSDSTAFSVLTSEHQLIFTYKPGIATLNRSDGESKQSTTYLPNDAGDVKFISADTNPLLKINYVFYHNYTDDTITQSYGAEEGLGIQITSPLNNSEVFNKDTPIIFTTANKNENHNIYIDGALNKTINATSSPWTEYFNFTTGQHNILVTLASNENINDLINITAKDFIITSTTYDSEEYELMYSPFNATIRHSSNKNVTNATINYNNTIYSMTLTNYDNTTTYATTTIFTPFLGASNYTYYNFTINATANDSSTDTYNNSQKIIIGYYISNTSVSQSNITEGAIEESNITVTMKTNYAVVQAYSTLDSTTTTATEQSNNSENHYWLSSYHAPSVTTSTDYNVTYYLTVTYGGTTATRQYTGYDTITVNPLNIGYCGGTTTTQILNYSLWSEQKHDTQLPIASGLNEWEARITAKASPNGNVVKTFGFKNTTQNLLICSNGENLTLNTSVWAWDNASNYVKHSHFMLEHDVSTSLEQYKIRLLNASLASVIDFYVYDVYGNPIENRIIHFYKYYPETNEYEELFNLITDAQGHATAKVRAYDTWYRIIITDSDGNVRKIITNTQISSNSISITEESLTSTTNIYDVTITPSWNNASKVFTTYFTSNNQHDYLLTTKKIGIWSNTTYCNTSGSGTTTSLYCDMSADGISKFQWIVSIKKDGQWVEVDGGIIASKEKPYGLMGLFATTLLVMIGSLIFYEPRLRLIGSMLGFTIAWLLQLVVISWGVVMGLWFVVAVIIYITRRGG